jgi:hypothetical protein
MNKLKTLSTIGAAVVAMTAASAAPATAQSWRHHDGYERHLTTSYVDGLAWRIDEAARRGVISWGQARNLRAELHQVQPLAWRVETGEASRWEYRRLSRTVDRIEMMTRGYASNRERPYAHGYYR